MVKTVRPRFVLLALPLIVLAGCRGDPTAHLSPERAEPYVLRLQAACAASSGAADHELLGVIAQELNARKPALLGPELSLEPCQKALAR